jgi:hypothetical protein
MSGVRVRPVPCFKMTAGEIVARLPDQLSEEEPAAESRRLRRTGQGERTLDDWGDLDQFNAQASRGVLRHMTEDEEKAGLSWEEFRPK